MPFAIVDDLLFERCRGAGHGAGAHPPEPDVWGVADAEQLPVTSALAVTVGLTVPDQDAAEVRRRHRFSTPAVVPAQRPVAAENCRAGNTAASATAAANADIASTGNCSVTGAAPEVNLFGQRDRSATATGRPTQAALLAKPKSPDCRCSRTAPPTVLPCAAVIYLGRMQDVARAAVRSASTATASR